MVEEKKTNVKGLSCYSVHKKEKKEEKKGK